MADLTPYQLSLSSASWIDINTQFTINGLPDRLSDEQAVALCGLYNLLNCPIYDRSRIFQPEYGSMWYEFLQEPIGDDTASRMQIAMIQAIARWEPRVNLDLNASGIEVDWNLPGYNVRIAFSFNLSSTKQSISFNIKV